MKKESNTSTMATILRLRSVRALAVAHGYMYVLGKPTALIDPNGMNAWIPPTEEEGAWTAEKGDSPGSLARDAKISQSQAEGVMSDYNKSNNNNRSSDIMVYEGDQVTLPGSGQESSSSSGSTTTSVTSNTSVTSSAASNLGSNPNSQTPDNTRGTIISAANGIAALGPIGGMFDVGGCVDSYGDSRMYFTIGWAQGFGASGGMSFGKTNKNFRFADMEGLSSGWQGIAFIFSGEMFQDMQKTGIGTSYVDKMTYAGGDLGTAGFGGFHYFSTTITAPVTTGEQLFNMVRHWH